MPNVQFEIQFSSADGDNTATTSALALASDVVAARALHERCNAAPGKPPVVVLAPDGDGGTAFVAINGTAATPQRVAGDQWTDLGGYRVRLRSAAAGGRASSVVELANTVVDSPGAAHPELHATLPVGSDGAVQQMRFLLPTDEGAEFRIGRSRGAGNHLVINDRFVSGRHVVLQVQSGRWVARCAEGARPFKVNGNDENGPCVLRNGDLLKVGRTGIQFVRAFESATLGPIDITEVPHPDPGFGSMLQDPAITPKGAGMSPSPIVVGGDIVGAGLESLGRAPVRALGASLANDGTANLKEQEEPKPPGDPKKAKPGGTTIWFWVLSVLFVLGLIVLILWLLAMIK